MSDLSKTSQREADFDRSSRPAIGNPDTERALARYLADLGYGSPRNLAGHAWNRITADQQDICMDMARRWLEKQQHD